MHPASPVTTLGPITTPPAPSPDATMATHAPLLAIPRNPSILSSPPNTTPASSSHQFKHPIEAPQDYMHTHVLRVRFLYLKSTSIFPLPIDICPVPSNHRSALRIPIDLML
jgi:hypothetical protein